MSKFTRLAKRIDSFRDEMVSMQIKLCALPSVSPGERRRGRGSEGPVPGRLSQAGPLR